MQSLYLPQNALSYRYYGQAEPVVPLKRCPLSGADVRATLSDPFWALRSWAVRAWWLGQLPDCLVGLPVVVPGCQGACCHIPRACCHIPLRRASRSCPAGPKSTSTVGPRAPRRGRGRWLVCRHQPSSARLSIAYLRRAGPGRTTSSPRSTGPPSVRSRPRRAAILEAQAGDWPLSARTRHRCVQRIHFRPQSALLPRLHSCVLQSGQR